MFQRLRGLFYDRSPLGVYVWVEGGGQEMRGGEDFTPNDQQQSEHSVQFDNKLFIPSDGLTESQI